MKRAAKAGAAEQAECRDWKLETTPLDEGRARLTLVPIGDVKLAAADPLAGYFFSGGVQSVTRAEDRASFEGAV